MLHRRFASANISFSISFTEGRHMARGIVPANRRRLGVMKARIGRPVKTSQKADVPRPVRPSQRPGAARAKTKSAPEGRRKGYNPVAPERIAEILKRLDQLYPEVTCALSHKSAWELLVATILSAQSTDVNVNRVTPELFRKYPTVADFAALMPETGT